MKRDDFERGMEKEQIVMQGMETVLRMLEALVKSKKYSDQKMEGFQELLKYVRQGGELRCEVIEPGELEVFRELLEKHTVAYGATVFKDAGGEERVNVMYKEEDEGRMRVVRSEFVQKKVERFVEPEEIRQGGVKVQGQAQEGNKRPEQGQMQDGVQKCGQEQMQDGVQKRGQEQVQGEVQKRKMGQAQGEVQKREPVQDQNVNASRNWATSAEREKDREKQESISR